MATCWSASSSSTSTVRGQQAVPNESEDDVGDDRRGRVARVAARSVMTARASQRRCRNSLRNR